MHAEATGVVSKGQRLVSLALLVGLAILAVPVNVLGDQCGADATVTPSSGPVGTVFVFEINLGEASDLRRYRNEHLVRTVFMTTNNFVRYEIPTHAGDAGTWRARAEVRRRPFGAWRLVLDYGQW